MTSTTINPEFVDILQRDRKVFPSSIEVAKNVRIDLRELLEQTDFDDAQSRLVKHIRESRPGAHHGMLHELCHALRAYKDRISSETPAPRIALPQQPKGNYAVLIGLKAYMPDTNIEFNKAVRKIAGDMILESVAADTPLQLTRRNQVDFKERRLFREYKFGTPLISIESLPPSYALSQNGIEQIETVTGTTLILAVPGREDRALYRKLGFAHTNFLAEKGRNPIVARTRSSKKPL